MNFRQIQLINAFEAFMKEQEARNAQISREIAEIHAKIERIAQSGGRKGPIPGLKAIRDRLEQIENDIR